MDEDSARKSEPSQSSTPGPRDGLIDFTHYSIEQLRELQFSIDKNAFPQNFINLLAALREKEEGTPQPPLRDNGYTGRFTSRSGVLGWLEAKARRSPVYGAGTVEPRPPAIILQGSQRTWLFVPIEAQVIREIRNVRNVVQDGRSVQFDIGRRFLPPERIQFQSESAAQAQHIVNLLPGTHAKKFLEHWTEIRDFNLRMQLVGGRPWITAVIVAVNVAIFIAMTIGTKKLGLFTLPEMLAWGANFGPLTVHGQWWRLFTALFVHSSLLHLALNMWALWNVGRLSERLFGPGTLFCLYVASGILASLASIAWDPSLSSVGASGAIFGVLGAFLAFLSRQRQEIPPVIVRKHWISTLAFALFNLISGALQPGIDNAAHVGGLLGGFVLGYILARPIDREARADFPFNRSFVAAAFIAIAVLAALWQAKGIGSGLTIPEKFARTHSDYMSGEIQNLQLWNALAARAGAGSISDAEFGQRFEQDILPFWQAQNDKLKKENTSLQGATPEFSLLIADFVNLRFQWASALIDATKNHDASRAAEAKKLMLETDKVNARLDRIGIRAAMDHRPRALAASSFVTKVRHFFSGQNRRCVSAPRYYDEPVADSDDKTDGPAVRYALSCQAQQLFLSGDFERLESLMNEYAAKLQDLPDGGSRFEGLVWGLTNLFQSSSLTAESAFGYTADWRRKVRGSVYADLVEAMVFGDWAYAARGSGYADTVTSQNWRVFAYRSEMEAAALADVAERAANYPLWYMLSLELGLAQSKDKEQLRAIFDRGVKIAPGYGALYQQMLRILMPRWEGSYEDVDKFINEIYARTAPDRGYERYAQLYSLYARMEGDDLDLFRDTPAFWSGMRTGYLELLKRYPKSDAVLNNFANFACRAGDKPEYNRLRSVIGQRISATSWSPKYSLSACDQQLGKGGEFHALGVLSDVAGRIETLGGVRLGMTRTELLAMKGNPVQREEKYWVYNTIDSKHNGVVTAVFSPEGAAGTVIAVAYSGDEISAPPELPYLNDRTAAEILTVYGPQTTGRLTLRADTTYTFRNGIYVNTREERVYRYGIYKTAPSLPR